jgi:hypothetical protein
VSRPPTLMTAVLVVAACGNQIEAAPGEVTRVGPQPAPPPPPPAAMKPADDSLCVTKGAARIGSTITHPAMRAVARGSIGEAASLEFVFRGDTEKKKDLATSGARRQLGLKLRAQNGCNVVYVMWRLDPKPAIDVSVKLNPGAKDHGDCGANGYRKVKPIKASDLPPLLIGARHALRATIAGDELTAWVDDQVAFRGRLPIEARSLRGPAGLRSDNLSFELVSFVTAPGDPKQPLPSCEADSGD